MKERKYVVGHVNPDTDSIASALGYAWLLRERDGDDAIAARAGALNQQTTWVLNRLQVEPPILLTDASPRFEVVTRRMDTTPPEGKLRDAWAVANRTGGVAPLVNDDGTPYGLLTGLSLPVVFEMRSRASCEKNVISFSSLMKRSNMSASVGSVICSTPRDCASF